MQTLCQHYEIRVSLLQLPWHMQAASPEVMESCCWELRNFLACDKFPSPIPHIPKLQFKGNSDFF